jgi:Lon protease-like protein
MYLPLFPLQAVVYPRGGINLHIFEPRYKELLNHVRATGTTFGILPVVSNKPAEFGTEVSLIEVEKEYSDGRMDVKLAGERIFRLLHFMTKAEEALYPAGIVTFQHEKVSEWPIRENIPQHEELFAALKKLCSVVGAQEKFLLSGEGSLTYQIAHYLGLSVEEEYELLCLPHEYQRQQRILPWVHRAVKSIEQRREIRRRIQLNGHFKELIPPHF